MGCSTILVIILWVTLSTLAYLEYVPEMGDLSIGEFLICVLVFLIGGPVFGINQILTAILECILPEGWDDNDRGH